MSEQMSTVPASLHYQQLTAILRDQPMFLLGGQPAPNGRAVKYSGIAKKRIRSAFCDIRKGERIDGLLLDSGRWFIMPAHNEDDDQPAGYRRSDVACVVQVPNESVAMRRERTPEEEAEWLEDKRAEYEADTICGDYWSNW